MRLALFWFGAIAVMFVGCGDDDGSSPASVRVGATPVEASITVSGGESGGSVPESDTSRPESTVGIMSTDTTSPAYVDVDVGPGLATDGFVGASDDVRLDRCELDGDHWVAAGMVTNLSGAGAGYRIYVAFNPAYSANARGLVQVDFLIPNGESQMWKAVAWITDPGLECVLRVERVSG
jgi:hypothetical protein